MKTKLALFSIIMIVFCAPAGLYAQGGKWFTAKKAAGHDMNVLRPDRPLRSGQICYNPEIQDGKYMHDRSVRDTLCYENFDEGASGWAFQDLWSEPFWHVSGTGAYSGFSYWCGIEELGGYDDIWQQTLTSPPVDLTGTTEPLLNFMHSYAVEQYSGDSVVFDGFDALTVRISTNGENFTVIHPASGLSYNAQNAYGFYLRFGTGLAGWYGDSEGWVPASFDLGDYAGQTVWIQFLLGSDEWYSTSEDQALFGWRIDDIRITDGIDTVFEDDAGDTGEAQFTAGGPGGPDLWHLTDVASASGQYSAGCFDSTLGHYLFGMKAGLVSPPVAINNLPLYTRALKADVQMKGVFDHTIDPLYFCDILGVEARIYDGGKWNFWYQISSTLLAPTSFRSYNEYNFYDLDLSWLPEADSVQLRFFLLTMPDDEVVLPAEIYLDDFTLIAQVGYDGEKFGAFYDRVAFAPLLERPSIVDSFMATLPTCPLIEDSSTVTFLYRGSATSVNVPGDANGWYTEGDPMEKIPGTDLWFRQDWFEPDARLEYKFFLNGVSWINDPLNPNIFNNQYFNNQIYMLEYVPPPEVEYNEDIPHGSYTDTLFTSSILGNTRKVRIYTPPSYNAKEDEDFPMVLFHDGPGFYNEGLALNVLDYLIAENLIQPLIAVFVPPVNRDAEYAFEQTGEFESFIIDELMPYIDAAYRTRKDAAGRAMLGASYGGLISTQVCYNRPESFGCCAPFSPAYGPKDHEVFTSVINGPVKNIKFYMDWGTYEYGIRVDGHIMKDNLIMKGYEVAWNEWHEGHTYGSWRAHLDNALEFFFPGIPGGVEEIATGFSMIRCYPNPFTNETVFQVELDEPANASLVVMDRLGRIVATVLDKPMLQGTYHITWNAGDLPSGVYLYRLVADERTASGKLIKF